LVEEYVVIGNADGLGAIVFQECRPGKGVNRERDFNHAQIVLFCVAIFVPFLS